ncbi:hypothetical protein BDP55DRAFT_547985 [Colletotrichum godetiae]|uniref:ADP-ribosylation factor n=1 Tax=Colletotrichum godetiae TaxID=1209918 RepID=A0AAJ0F043_9PEZI|nr:uncharacterized protein BDP55DRAFT_547985 [Colletotrichum godetiae]KAK1688153.1 hypothetical protein BDP55DRAFT_547985 [Colletotrichum godetiae]
MAIPTTAGAAAATTTTLDDKFQNLDDEAVYAHVKAEAANDKALNFVVEFNHHEALIAFNLTSDDFSQLVTRERKEGMRIGVQYKFSKRLLAIMTALALSSLKEANTTPMALPRGGGEGGGDVEKGSSSDGLGPPPPGQTQAQVLEELEIYQLVKETVNYTSIDQGKHCDLLPPRHWSWLALCSDSVVVSFHETPSSEDEKELVNMRSNTTSVLCQLSKHGVEDFERRLLSLKPVRQAMSRSELDGNAAREGSSNLFYYLFEDYSSALPVLKTSKNELGRLVSNEDRLLSNHELSTKDGISADTIECQLPSSIFDEVNISLSARSRFERLGDRLQLLMLNTIQEYLDEQNALSNTYFNLTAQRDSQATARLSRSATVLAKLSVFFLPITFMTSYFSVEIPDLVEHYTPKMYWVCFAVIAGISFISLFFFSRMIEVLSDVLEAWAHTKIQNIRRSVGLSVQDDREEH